MQGKTTVNLRRLFARMGKRVEEGLGEMKEEDWEAVRTRTDGTLCGKGIGHREGIAGVVRDYIGRKSSSIQTLYLLRKVS